MATINGIEMQDARRIGEMTNCTNFREAQMEAYLLLDQDGETTGYLEYIRSVTVDVRLRPGYSPYDHLFDRAAERAASAVEGRLFASLAEIRKVALGARASADPQYSVELTLSPSHRQVRAGEFAETVEAIQDRQARKESAARLRKERKFVARLVATESPSERNPDSWILRDPSLDRVRHTSVDGYGYARYSPTSYLGGICSAPTRYPSQEAAEAAKAEILASLS